MVYTGINANFHRSIVNNPVEEHKEGFYATPPRGTRALLSVEKFRGAIWECACGNGVMSEVLQEGRRAKVISTELYDRGYGERGVDFLAQTKPRAPNIVTNPPFKLAEQFLEKALSLTTGKVAFLCRLAWLEGQRRGELLQRTPLVRVWVFSTRLPTSRAADPQYWHNPETDKGGMVAFAWYVWEHGHVGPPTLGWLP